MRTVIGIIVVLVGVIVGSMAIGAPAGSAQVTHVPPSRTMRTTECEEGWNITIDPNPTISLKEMVNGAGYDVTEGEHEFIYHLPCPVSARTCVETDIIMFEDDVTTVDALTTFAVRDLRPASAYELIVFALEHPERVFYGPTLVALLGVGGDDPIYVTIGSQGMRLEWRESEEKWERRFTFLAIRK